MLYDIPTPLNSSVLLLRTTTLAPQHIGYIYSYSLNEAVQRSGNSHNTNADDDDHDRYDDGRAEVLPQPEALDGAHERDIHELHDLRMAV